MDILSQHAYTVRLFAPEFTADEVDLFSDKLLDSDLLQNRQPIVSSDSDRITVTFVESSRDIRDHLREILFLARVSLHDIGIKHPVVTEVFATPTDLAHPLDAHVSVTEDMPLLERIELTDTLLHEEL